MANQVRFVKRSKKKPLSLFSLIIALAVIFITCVFNQSIDDKSLQEDNSDFVIDFIDVGQGDCELIRCNGTVVLIDGGESDAASDVIDFLKNKSVNTIDYYILTHPHSDHIGAAPSIMKNFKIGTVISTAISDDNLPTTACYEKTVDAIYNYASDYLEVEAGDKFKWGELTVSVLAPFEESEEYNDISVCCRIEYKNFSVLLCGDATKKVEYQILDSKADIRSDVMKISHHGSSSSNSEDFIKAVDPDFAVISCGTGNSYGHPHRETIDTLNNTGTDYFRTDESGTVSVYSDGNKWSVELEKE